MHLTSVSVCLGLLQLAAAPTGTAGDEGATVLTTDLPGELSLADRDPLASQTLDPVVDVLIAEFNGQLPAHVVIEHIVLACEQLIAAGVRAGLCPATESMARSRLRAVSAQAGA